MGRGLNGPFEMFALGNVRGKRGKAEHAPLGNAGLSQLPTAPYGRERHRV